LARAAAAWVAAWVDVEAYVVRETGVKTGAAVGWARVVDSDVAAVVVA
jgi:hypothetical protein